jgi:hypothetical protein
LLRENNYAGQIYIEEVTLFLDLERFYLMCLALDIWRNGKNLAQMTCEREKKRMVDIRPNLHTCGW